MSHDSLYEVAFVSAGKLGQSPNLAQNHLFQKIHTDVVSRGASPLGAVIIGTVEVAYIMIALAEMVVSCRLPNYHPVRYVRTEKLCFPLFFCYLTVS